MNKTLGVRSAIGTCLVLLVPLVMSILDRHKPEGDGWHWGPLDFVAMGALIFGAGLAYELAARKLADKRHGMAVGAMIFLAVVIVWVELAVDGISRLVGS